MSTMCRYGLIVASAALVVITAGPYRAAGAAPSPETGTPLPTLYLIGDSTVNTHTKELLGWGTPLKAYFDPARIRVINRARGGRSSRTFLTEGLWGAVAAELRPGDFVLMQFGHNDGGSFTGPRGRASIKGSGEETRVVVDNAGKNETVHSYGWYLRQYIAGSKERGAIPIVLSPIPRNIWSSNGSVNRSDHDYGKWAAEAAQQGGAYFVNLNGIIADRYDRAGMQEVSRLYFTAADHTHTTPAGAEFNARAVVAGINALNGCHLKDYLSSAGAGILPAASPLRP